MPLAPVERFIHWTYFMGNDDKRRLMTGAAGAWEPSERVVRQVLESSPLADPSNRLLHADVKTFLVDNVLEYTDKMSMAVSLESRVPLLDANFVEFSLNVPFRQKLEYGRSKILLRNVFARFLPPEAQKAPKKGFNAPLSRWVRNTLDGYFEASHQERHPLKETLGESIGTTWMEERVLDWSFIQRLRDQHLRGKADYSYELFSILMFDLWWRKHISAA
jgi:asparagine synthase (glutamine-hydrolysing)